MKVEESRRESVGNNPAPLRQNFKVLVLVLSLFVLACGSIVNAEVEENAWGETAISGASRDHANLLNLTVEEELGNLVLVGRAQEMDDTKVDRLHLIRKSWKRSPVVSLDDLFESRTGNPLKEMIAEESPAAMAVLFLANSDGCHAMFNGFSRLAKAYWDDMERRRSVSTSKIFFLVANLTRGSTRMLFKDHRVTRVPTLVMIPLGAPYPSNSFPEEWVMDPSMGTTLEDLAQWIESTLSGSFKFSSAVLGAPSAAAKISGSFTSAVEDWGLYIIAAQVLVIFLSNAYRFTSKNAWLSASIGVYFFSVSGCIFCFLRGVPPFGYSDQHGFMFIYPDRSGQFFLEGLAIGFLNCMISLVMVIAAEMSNGTDTVAQMEEWFDGEPPERVIEERRYGNHPLLVQQRLQKLFKTASICVGVAIVLTFNVFILFKRKTPWYRPFSF